MLLLIHMVPLISRKPTMWAIPAFLLGFGIALFLYAPSVGIIGSPKLASVCYYRGTVGEYGTDYALVTVSPSGMDSYTGVYNWVLAEKDSARGFWHGGSVRDGDSLTIDALSTMSGESQITLQQQVLKITDDTLAIGHGDLQESSSVYVYASTTALDFSGDILSKINCDDVPVEAW